MSVRFGFITDVHYASDTRTIALAPGGGSHLRRYNTADQRLQQSALAFKAENEIRGLDFWMSNGDEIDFSLGTPGVTPLPTIRVQDYITDSKLAGDILFYMTQGHHTQASFDPMADASRNGDFTWDDYYNILYHPVTGNHGAVENAFPGDIGYPYSGGWDGTSGDFHWPLSYTFTKKGIKFIVYTRYYGGIDRIASYYDDPSTGTHKDWLREQLNTSLPVVIFSHAHLWQDSSKTAISSAFDISDWDTGAPDGIQYILEDAGNVKAVFGGHWHDGNRNMELNGIKYFSMKGSIKTSITQEEYDNAPTSPAALVYKRPPIREDAASENAYYVIEVTDDFDVLITGYGYNGEKMTTTNYNRYPIEEVRYSLNDGSSIESNSLRRRFSLLDNNVADVASSGQNYFEDSDISVTVDGETYIVGSDVLAFEPSGSSVSINSIGTLIWDRGGANEYTFQSIDGTEGEYITFVNSNGNTIKVTWEGKGSHQFLVEVIAGDLTSTDLDAYPITYYKAKAGESDLDEDTWYINSSKKHAFKIYSDFDPIEDV